MYETDYIFTAPESSKGINCIPHCENARTQCTEIEQLRVERCELQSERDQRDCEDDIYYRKGRDPKWYECVPASCSVDEERCEEDYRRCFQACGGKVEKVTRCVANCEQIPGYKPGRQE